MLMPAEREDWIVEFADELATCGDKGAELLCELAQIPPVCKEQFLEEMGQALVAANIGRRILIHEYDHAPKEAIEEFERRLRAAYSAFLAIPEEWRDVFCVWECPDVTEAKAIAVMIQRAEHWDSIFQRLIRKCAELTGSDPRVMAKRGRGRHKKQSTKGTYWLKAFLWKLARIIKRHGGRLTLTRASQSGTWVDALNGLRPLLPSGASRTCCRSR